MQQIDIWLGDAIDLMRRNIADRSIDLVYADPPFGTNLDWTARAGSFSDKWTWNAEAAAQEGDLGVVGQVLGAIAPSSSLRAYLAAMATLFVEIQRVLKLSGVFLLHCDDTMRSYLRVALDLVFGDHTLTEIVWKRTSAHSHASRGYGRVHDTIVVVARHRRGFEARAWRYDFAKLQQELIDNGVLTDLLNPQATERVGYPTQKPVSLLERLIRAVTCRDDLVLDPMCGSGTTIVAAKNLGRRAIGIDRNSEAIDLTLRRVSPVIRPQLEMFEAAR